MKNSFNPAVKLLAPVFLGLVVFSCGKGCETVYFTVDVNTSLPGDTVAHLESSPGVLMAPPEAMDAQPPPGWEYALIQEVVNLSPDILKLKTVFRPSTSYRKVMP